MIQTRKGRDKFLMGVFQLSVVLLAICLTRLVPYADIQDLSVFSLLVLHFISYYVSNAYRDFLIRGYLQELIAIVRYSLVLVALVSVSSFILKDNFIVSRRGLLFFTVINGACLYAFDRIMQAYYKNKRLTKGSAKQIYAVTVLAYLDRVLANFSDTSNDYLGDQLTAITVLDAKAPLLVPGLVVVPVEEMISYATHAVVDEVFINLPSDSYPVSDYIAQFEVMGVDVSLNINALEYQSFGAKRIRQLSHYNVVTFSSTFYKGSHIVAKRILDICGALCGLLICGFFGLFLAPLIKLDGGPVIFKQQRVGKNGRVFDFYKFRSMRVGAEKEKASLLAQNTVSGLMFKVDNDPRVTPIGRFLRRTSLDELPQFWNVLKGDMSLVGTRPPTVDEYEQYNPMQKRRLSFKPGITGLWQVSGRSNIKDFDEIVAMDVAYIDTWTIWSDVKVLVKTLKVVLLGSGAK